MVQKPKLLLRLITIFVIIVLGVEMCRVASVQLYQDIRPLEFSKPHRTKGTQNLLSPSTASTSLEDDCKDGIRAFSYATDRGTFFFCDTLESALHNRVALRILGWGEKWDGFLQKLQASLEAIQRLPSSCTVLFVDSYDVLFVHGLAEIQRKFMKMDARILFSAECGCWPFILKNRSVCRSGYPEAPTMYRYLNYGGWIARQEDAVRLLREIVGIANRENEAGNDVDDQEISSNLYIAGQSGIELDHNSQIFQTLHSTTNIVEGKCNPWPHLVAYDGGWHNEYTGSNPSILHFNGGGKRRLRKMKSMLWYKQYNGLKPSNSSFPTPLTSSQLQTTRINAGTNSTVRYTYREICHTEFIDRFRGRLG